MIFDSSDDTLASGCFWGFPRKNMETHMALHGNFSSPVSATDLVKVSKDATSLVACTLKKIFGSEVPIFCE